MNIIDMLIIALVGISGLLGLYWGIIRQVLSVVGVIVGIVLASRYGGGVADWIEGFGPTGRVADILGFAAVFVAVTTASSLLASVLHQVAEVLFLGWADHLIGGVLGVAQGAIVATVIVAILSAIPSEQVSSLLRDSQYAPNVIHLSQFVLALLPESLRMAAEVFFPKL